MPTIRISSIVLLLAASTLPPPAEAQTAQSPLTGTWVTYNFGPPNLINIEVNGSRALVTISRGDAVVTMREGAVSGNTVTFRSSGLRFTKFTGRLDGDELLFDRDVEILPGGLDNGLGIYGGSQAITEFVAHRDAPAGVAIPRALFGSWRMNIARSTFDPGPPPTPHVPSVVNFVSKPGGDVELLGVVVGPTGNAQMDFATLRADGRDHPLYNEVSLGDLFQSQTPTPYTLSLIPLGNGAFEMVDKMDGVVRSRRRLNVSADGNTLTAAETVVNAQGRTTATNRLIFERLMTTEGVPPTN
jgi:hypothetical protein